MKIRCLLFFTVVVTSAMLLSSFTLQQGRDNRNMQLTLSVKSVSVVSFLDMIKARTGVSFVYDANLLSTLGPVTVEAEERTLEEVLNQTFMGKGIIYTIKNNIVTLTAAKQQPSATTGIINGIVVDDLNEPISGVTIRVKGFKGDYTTDSNGTFSIRTSNRIEELTFSFMGFKSQTLEAYVGQSLKVKLIPDVESLNEVVVIGFIKKSKQSYTGSQTTVKREELLSVGTKNLFTSIAAFVPGLVVLENNLAGSNPNQHPEINIRGRASFEGAANIPLFVVDGAQVGVEYIFDMDMNDVETVTVLKDASATAMYGAKGAAGVIVITTKSLQGGALRFNYSGTLRTSMPDLSEYSLLNAKEKLEYECLAGMYTSDSPLIQANLDLEYAKRFTRVQGGVNTNWLAKPLRIGTSQNHNLSVNGGDDHARYSVGVRYGLDNGVMKGSFRERLGSNFRLTYNTDSRLFLSNMATITYVNSGDSPYGSFSSYAKINPYDTPYDENGDLAPILSYRIANPLYNAMAGNTSTANNLTIMNNTDIQYWLNDAIRFDASASITLGRSGSRRFISPLDASQLDKIASERGNLTENNSTSLIYSGKLMATYNKHLTQKLFMNTTIGANVDAAHNEGSTFTAAGFYSSKLNHPGFAQRYNGKPFGNDDITRNVGFFINANAMYDNRYFVDVIYRYEGSSQFGSNKRFSPFWSAGAGWNIHNESWLKDSGITTLKLRASTGYLGNVGFSAYQAITTMSYSGLDYEKGVGAVPLAIGNPNLSWERTFNNNVGLDLTLFKGRWDLSFDAYYKSTDNLLLDVTKAPSVGVDTAKENLGSVINQGFDFHTRIIPIRTNDMQWSLSLNGAYNQNKIVKISEALKEQNRKNIAAMENDQTGALKIRPVNQYEEGGSLNDLFVVPSAGIDPATGKEIYIRPDGSYTFDYNSDYRQRFGVRTPVINGTFSSYFIYKQWSLNAVFGYTFGAVDYNSTLASRVEGSDPKYNADKRVFNDRWKSAGTPARYKDIADKTTPYQTSRFVSTNNTINMNSLSLAYEFRSEQIKALRLRSLRFEVLTNNLFYFSTIKQERGTDYPFERSVELSARLTF